MSWLARSFANSLRLDGDGDDENDTVLDPPTTSLRDPLQHQTRENAFGSEAEEEEEEENEETEGRGVKEDLDEIKQTLTRQFWGMASFLAPPATNSHSLSLSHAQSDPSSFISDQFKHRSLSPNEEPQLDEAAVSNRSNSVSLGSDSEGDCGLEQRAVGITEEVLAFAMNIAMHPETWLDFPIDEEDDTDGNFMHTLTGEKRLFNWIRSQND